MKHTEPYATSECLSGDTIFVCISAVSTSEHVYLASVVWLYMDQHDWGSRSVNMCPLLQGLCLQDRIGGE